MKFAVRDAFGQIRGLGTVTWMPSEYTEVNMSIEKECEAIFENVITVELPTKNSRMSWRLDVYPRL